MFQYPKFEDLVGKILDGVTVNDDTIEFSCVDGTNYMLYHSQDCCEYVYVEDVCGDVEDLVGSEILLANETSNNDFGECSESCTWTFYNIGTIKGSVTIRFYGTSNGYYSEGVSFVKLNRDIV